MRKFRAAVAEPAYFPLFLWVAEETYVIKVDLNYASLPEETEPAPNEENPGGFLALNDNDNDGEAGVDKDRSTTATELTTADPDLRAVMFAMTPVPDIGTVTLTIPSGIRVWENAKKKSLIAGPWDLASSTQKSALQALLANGAWFEGIGTGTGDLTLSYGSVCSDKVKMAVVKADLDIDSDNSNGLGAPDRSLTEDQSEDIVGDPTKPGKLVVVNNSDADNEGVPNFADGIDVWGNSGLNAGGQFTPMLLELSEPLDLSKVKVRFTYSDSDPNAVTRSGSGTVADPYVYTAASGHLRVWKIDGAADRLAEEVDIGGHFVKSGSEYSPSDLGAGRIISLYIEGIDKSVAIADQRFVVSIDPDGSGPAGWISSDAVRCTVIKVEIDKIAFNYKPATATDEALDIRENFTTAISVPEYVRGGQNKPAAYIRNKAVKILVSLKVAPNTITSLKIKGVSDDTTGSLGDATEKTVTFSGGISQGGADDPATTGIDESEYIEFAINGNTPNKVFKSEEAWKWIITEVGGTAVADMEVERTSEHNVYVLWDAPKSPWNQMSGNAKNPWVKALKFAVETASGHDKDDTGALAAITSYLHTGHGLTYHINGGASAYASSNLGGTMDLTGYIDKSWGNTINCYDQASGVCSLGRLLGIAVEYRYMNPFGYINTVNLVGEGNCNNPFYPLTTGGKITGADAVSPVREGFGNHAFAKYGGNIYDATAGPHAGTRTEAQYVSDTVDSSTPAEAAFPAGNTTNISPGAVSDLK